MTVHQKFIEDMHVAGISTDEYLGRFFWQGPAAHSDQHKGPTLQNIINVTEVPLQWDIVSSGYVVYPIGNAKAVWDDDLADSEEDDDERDGYSDGYVTKAAKNDDDED